MSDTSQNKYVDMAHLLWPVDGLSNEELERTARALYTRHCTVRAKHGAVTTHDGERVYLFADEDTFVHAFFTAGERHRRGWAKDVVDPRRVERIRWIVPVISGLVDGTQCYRVMDYASYGKPAPEKRLYIVRKEQYVVWLIRRNDGGFRFRTAYVAGNADIDRYVHRQRKIWER